MALTDAQKADIRYYMGYSVAGDDTIRGSREAAYSNTRMFSSVSLDEEVQGLGLLSRLTVAQESRLTTFFLPNLAKREAEIQTAAANLDTDVAAVWTRNRSEISDRTSLFTALRMDLCRFLGFPPGSGLVSRNRLVRS